MNYDKNKMWKMWKLWCRMIEQYLQEYLQGKLNIDINQLDNFDKIKYEKQRQLLDVALKSINELLVGIEELKKLKDKQIE